MQISNNNYSRTITGSSASLIPMSGSQVSGQQTTSARATGGSVTTGSGALSSLSATLSVAALDAKSKDPALQANVSTDWSDPNNWLFQNLMKDPSVQRVVSQNEDGTYSENRVMNNGVKDMLARAMVRTQNGADVNGLPPGDPNFGKQEVVQYSANDQTKFKELTGYNMVFVGGGTFVVDDQGNPPAAEDAASVQQMLDTFDLASGTRGFGTPEHDLDASSLTEAAQALRSQNGANTGLIDQLLSLMEKSFATTAETLAKQAKSEVQLS